ncbi:hypothetical protein BDR26DRAFT_10867 [Obelidium mucronatum]|nr:hypothetical protein BDR26DRAFT_10867 [Obelidium mucronatum]
MSTLESEQAMSSVTPTKTGVFHRILPQQTEDMTVRWARTTLGSMIAVCVISIALEVWIIILELQAYTSFDGVNEEAIDPNDMSKNIGNFIIGLTYHAVFIGSVLFQLFVTWNGLLHQNSLQIISINIYNISLWIYSITQIIQTRKDLDALYDGIPYDFKPFLAAMLPLAIVTGAFIPIYAYLTYRLRLEFAWRMYRITGGEKRVKDIFTTYHILLLLNKYAFCFVVGFTFLHLVLE